MVGMSIIQMIEPFCLKLRKQRYYHFHYYSEPEIRKQNNPVASQTKKLALSLDKQIAELEASIGLFIRC